MNWLSCIAMDEYNRKKAICGEESQQLFQDRHRCHFYAYEDDHMRNGQLKPGYNVQFAVNSGFITGIVFSNRTDFNADSVFDLFIP